MRRVIRNRTIIATLAMAITLSACGGGGSDNTMAPAPLPTPTPAPTPTPPVVEPGAPAVTNNIATDGLNWLNFRRSQLGVSSLARSSLVDSAAQSHSTYQRINNIVSHDQIAGREGFTGVTRSDRLRAAGYVFNGSFAFGEVISASTSSSGQYLAEELITAIYHRFVIFEPRFKEIGAGAATNASGYTYLTTNFASNNGFGTGIGRGNIVTWPISNQTGVTRNFFSDFETPDPVAELNEVGYPISVHADLDAVLTVTTFTLRERGVGDDLQVKLLASPADQYAPRSAASIVPLSVLKRATVYDVNFTGTSAGTAVTRAWSFTTRP